MIRVAIVDDFREDAAVLEQYLYQFGGETGQAYLVTRYTSGPEFLQDRSTAFDLVILDVNLPDGNGFDLCRIIKQARPELPVIFLTVRSDAKDIVDGFSCGADDYVVKPFELEVLHSRIQALLRRTRDAAGKYLSCGEISLDREKMQVYRNGAEVPLSPIEYQLLLTLLENKGRTVTRQSFLEKIWDSSGNFVNDNTLTVTMKRLRDKLDAQEHIKTIYGIGYKFEWLVK